ncbi:MAG: rod shape-determining protein MreC [Olsenella sp.]|nr:rod shape-determining protein MreC [Olsenella sp.]
MPTLNTGGANPSGFRRNDASSGGRLLIVFVVLSLVMFTVSARENGSGPFSIARGVVSTIAMPVRFVGSAMTAPLQGLGNIFANLTADQGTLSDLRAENEKLKARNSELEEAEKTATRLQNLLALQSTYSLQSTAARIISGSTDSWSDTVTIDKGSSAGLAVGMPVSDSNGAIGQVIECGPASSTVRLISDENSSVSAMVQSSRAQGMLRGSADGTLTLNLIGTDQVVNVGDAVVTSGLGGVFPKGLPLGTVASVNKTAGALYFDIVVSPLSKTENFEEVIVITSLTEGQRATAEDIQSADSQGATKSGDGGTESDGDKKSGNESENGGENAG